MKQLEKVQNNTTWAKASNAINNNNDALYVAVTTLEHAAFKNKGYFKSVALLYGAYPTAENGAQAFVYNSSNPTSAPYDIYEWVNGGWQDSGINGGNVNVNLDSKQDTLVGYSESVSNGKATQVAIQGDAIALSGKVSLGNVDDMESAILMSSSQSRAAIAKANTLEQSMNAIKSPIKPIQLNSQGKLELNIGKGLYIEDGKLCTTGASGGGGGGTTLSEGAGISILNNKISVAYNMETLGIDSCGGLTVNYGEGLTIKNGKLSAQASVNAGNGLVKKGDALQVSVGTGLVVEDDVYVNIGKGLATDNVNKVNVNLDEQTLTTDSSGKVIVNKDSLIGNGLKQEYGKLAVNYGTGLALSNKAIVINYGAGLDIQGGKLVSTVQGGKTYVAGDAIGFDGNNINVRYDGVTISTKNTADRSLHVMLGSGLKQGTSGIDVAVGAGLAIGSDNQIYCTVDGGKTYTAGDGIDINGNKIAVLYGSGLTTNTCGKLIVDAANLTVGYADYAYYAPTSCSAQYASYAESADHAAVSCSASYASSAGKATADANGNNIADTYLKSVGASGDGISISGGKIAVKYGTGLGKSTDNKLQVLLGTGLAVEGDYIRVEEAVYDSIEEANAGVDRAHEVVTQLQTALGGKQDRLSVSDGLKLANSVLKLKLSTSCSNINTSGLGYDDNGGLMVTVSTGLGIDRKIDGRLYIRCGTGITCNTDNDLTVRYGSGLDVLDGKLVLHEDIYYRLDSAEGGIGKCINAITKLHTAVGGKQNTLTLATGLEWGKTDMIQVKMNAPLNYDNCGRLKLDYDSTLTVSNNKLGVYTYGIINNEGGLTIKNNGLAVNVGRGLKIDSCQVVVDYGTGLKVVNNKLDVDTSKIAGVGIDLDSDYKMLTIGTKAAQELAGKGLVADGSKMKVKYGSGLTTNSCGNLIVDAANLTVGNADKLGGVGSGSYPRQTLLYERGDYQLHVVLLCKYGAGLTNTYHRLSGRIYSVGHGFGRYVAADVDIFVVDWNGGMDKFLRFDSYGINEMDLVTCNYGGVKYLAIRIYGVQAKTVYFEGTSTNMLLTPIKYYTSNTNTVNNAEIHGSMAVVSASQPSSNGNKYALVTDTVAQAIMADKAGTMNIAQVAQQNECVPAAFDSMQVFKVYGSSATNTEGDDGWILSFRWSHSGYLTQIYVDVDDTHIMSMRHRRADSTWTEWKRVAFTDQIIAGVTNGLAMNNDRVLYLPNLTSTLEGNAVDGSKNGAQRVLNLSCGAIQIKLSTGLAIDDNGYLYIQDKYVTK